MSESKEEGNKALRIGCISILSAVVLPLLVLWVAYTHSTWSLFVLTAWIALIIVCCTWTKRKQ